MKKSLINEVNLKELLVYGFTKDSLFRKNQDLFVSYCSTYANGTVIEIGSELKYGYNNKFPHCQFVRTNPFREQLLKLDVTAINLEANSVDNYLCISVLEHVLDIQSAAKELTRTLKPGGHLFIATPFAYPLHDVVDYWRILPDSYEALFDAFEIKEIYHFGGKFSSCAEVFKRPRGNYSLKLIPQRIVGWISLVCSILFERIDGFPQGYGLILRKK
jgi:SAM-dependent methyltransferase